MGAKAQAATFNGCLWLGAPKLRCHWTSGVSRLGSLSVQCGLIAGFVSRGSAGELGGGTFSALDE